MRVKTAVTPVRSQNMKYIKSDISKYWPVPLNVLHVSSKILD